MKNNLIKYSIALLSMVLFIQNTRAQEEYTKNPNGYGIEEKLEIKANKLLYLDISNQHGNITIQGWDRDTIEIHTLINVNTPGPNAAEEVLEFISIQRAQVKDKVIFRTQFDEEFFSNFPFNIDYTVKVPKRLNLSIKNKLGDVLIQDVNGSIKLMQNYGHLHLVNSQNKSAHNIQLQFIEAIIENCQNLTADFTNSSLNASESNKIDVNSEYSILSFKQCSSIKLHSNTDRVNINNTDSLTIIGEQVLVNCDELNTFGFIELKKGHLELKVNRGLKQLSISNQSANSNITLPQGFPYVINGEVSNGQFSHPNSTQLQLLKEANSISISGEVNAQNGTNCELVLFNNNSDLTIKTE